MKSLESRMLVKAVQSELALSHIRKKNGQSYWTGYKRGDRFDWRLFTEDHFDDIAAVQRITTRDDTGIDYEIRLTLRSQAKSNFEEGEGQIGIWCDRVDFGHNDQTRAGGDAFVRMAREQDRIADTISEMVRMGGHESSAKAKKAR